MALDDYDSPDLRNNTVNQDPSEYSLIYEVLDEVFDSGYVDSLIRDELEEQFEAAGISVEDDATLPNTPYSWKATEALKETWPVFVAEYILSNEARCDRQYQQAAARATEHLSCSAAETVKSALTRRTFYKPYTYDHEQYGTIEVSSPSAKLIRDILDEIERLLRTRESDVIE
ncbi:MULTISPECIES: hypothetical protein [Halobacterium]|uniref:hypothetical protein n=1 Tax=Halobacterium TaxID=2239 RepID=UPI00073EE404|nr:MULTISPECIES: hypothetical protein [Halobacterium]MCG1001915.1 hypothetical protein [Halobacterium noricense]